ncbi:DNA-3-methyladenine glycosylase 1 [Eucalyptus grandis]|uniref:DNA-3-methyladenine glycosylase 1 n=1 Tax=Eucalyptus grandis TaxID=71139 RepID=UPI00192E97AE|nr:DNA-3-methyladenine glycosylase 1 [Eucalyptus grandis]
MGFSCPINFDQKARLLSSSLELSKSQKALPPSAARKAPILFFSSHCFTFQIADEKIQQNPTSTPSSPPPPPAAATAAAASKIPFRPRKTRKLTNQRLDPETAAAAFPSRSRRPRILKPLSSDGEIELALGHLRRADPLLSALIGSLEAPTFASSARPFLALARSILYQQLATKAAQTIYARFLALFGGGGGGGEDGEDGVSPDSLLALSPQQLRQAGVSGRKAGYLHDLAENFRSGALSDESILEMEDEALLTALTRVKGIGVWSVHMFMMFSLHRPDVLPVGDLGVRKGVQAMHELKELPKPLEMEELCEKWRPYRSVGSWYMWRLMESKAAAAKAMPASAPAPVQSR